jgi:hypothetical protein
MSDIDSDEGAQNTRVADKQELRPARKQVKPGEVTKNEVQQSGKEYSKQSQILMFVTD